MLFQINIFVSLIYDSRVMKIAREFFCCYRDVFAEFFFVFILFLYVCVVFTRLKGYG